MSFVRHPENRPGQARLRRLDRWMVGLIAWKEFELKRAAYCGEGAVRGASLTSCGANWARGSQLWRIAKAKREPGNRRFGRPEIPNQLPFNSGQLMRSMATWR